MLPNLVRCLPVILAIGAFTAAAKESPVEADLITKQLLRRAEFEQVQISPNGKLLAIAQRKTDRTIVTINDRETLAVIRKLDPRENAEVETLEWLDDERLIVGANYINGMYGVAFTDPTLFIVRVDGSEAYQLPANFVSTIDGDPDRILVSRCRKWVDDDCILELHTAELRKRLKQSEFLLAAPDSHSYIRTDRKGKARFAVGYYKDGTTKTWIRSADDKSWTLINDESKTKLEVWPVGVAADGSSGFAISERSEGTDAIERVEFATGKRTELLRETTSDPLDIMYSVVGKEPIGAVFGATKPQLRFWNEAHPDARILLGLQKAFPGKLARLINASKDGNLAVVYTSSDRDPGSFYVLDRQAKTAALVAQASPWLQSEQLGSAREFSFTARDGLLLHGLLTIPPGSSGKNLPLVVLPHGGPFGIVDRWGFDHEAQILATHGFAVVQVNFRGSGGYGRAFMDRGMLQWGKAMQDDVTDATQWAVSQGIADASRMCIYGGSYGGYAAMMGVIREPSLYRCAAGYAGVYDLNKLYKWTGMRRTVVGRDYLSRYVGTDKAELAAYSPAQLPDKIKVPVLLAHGSQDGIVEVLFARDMNKALKKHKQPTELIVYPYMGHGLVLEEQRNDFYARLLVFLQTHTAAAGSGTAVDAPMEAR